MGMHLPFVGFFVVYHLVKRSTVQQIAVDGERVYRLHQAGGPLYKQEPS
jgi:hypothetical protein